MIIANPIFDTVFKRLMEDYKTARFFIETILAEPVEDIVMRPQEFTHSSEVLGLSIYSVDYIATIKTADGHKKVLIEIQKAKKAFDLLRFRSYLGEQQKKEDEIDTPNGKQMVELPIVTIYLLGFKLPEVEASAIKVNRQYIDLKTQHVLEAKSDFIEKLTHNCFVVQMQRIEDRLQTRLDRLLSVFEQKYFIDDKGTVKEYNHDIKDSDIKRMLDILHHSGTDPKERKEMEGELEIYRLLNINA